MTLCDMVRSLTLFSVLAFSFLKPEMRSSAVTYFDMALAVAAL